MNPSGLRGLPWFNLRDVSRSGFGLGLCGGRGLRTSGPLVIFCCLALACNVPAGMEGRDQTEAAAQDPAAPCLLSLVPTGVHLEADQGGRTPDPTRGVAVDGSGRFLTRTRAPGVLAYWDADGGFRAALGRLGEGPGEFGQVSRLLAGPGDTFHVFHEGRWSLVTPSLEVIAVARSPLLLPERAEGAAILQDGRLLVPGSQPGDALAVVVNRAGEVDAEIGVLRAGALPLMLPPGIAYHPDDIGFLVGPLAWTDSSWVVERWSLEGDRLQSWERVGDWIRQAGGAGTPLPTMGRLGLHRRGMVHLSASAPNPSLRPGAAGMEGSPRWPRFEILEAGSGRLLAGGWYGFAGETVGEMWGLIPGSALTYRIATTPGGLERLEILRMELRPRPGRSGAECGSDAPP